MYHAAIARRVPGDFCNLCVKRFREKERLRISQRDSEPLRYAVSITQC